jgi:hypothetical protein
MDIQGFDTVKSFTASHQDAFKASLVTTLAGSIPGLCVEQIALTVSLLPAAAPTNASTMAPTDAPTKNPTKAPTDAPTKAPTNGPTPTAPTKAPTKEPTVGRRRLSSGSGLTVDFVITGINSSELGSTSTAIEAIGSDSTSFLATLEVAMVAENAVVPSDMGVEAETSTPTAAPTPAPSSSPTTAPTPAPTLSPTGAPTAVPTKEPTAVPTEKGDTVLKQFGTTFQEKAPAPEEVPVLLEMLKLETNLFKRAASGAFTATEDGEEVLVPSYIEVANGLSALSFFVDVVASANSTTPTEELETVVHIMSDLLDPDLVAHALSTPVAAEDGVLAHDDAVFIISQRFKQVCKALARVASSGIVVEEDIDIAFQQGGLNIMVKRADTVALLGSPLAPPWSDDSSGDSRRRMASGTKNASFVLPLTLASTLPSRVRVMSWSNPALWRTSETDKATATELAQGSQSTMGGFTGTQSYGLSIFGAYAHSGEVNVRSIPDGGEISIRMPLAAEFHEGASSMIFEHECRYFHELAGEWRTDGCRVGEVGADYIICMCTHLTEFASFKKIPAPTRAPTPAPPPGVKIPDPVDCEVTKWTGWGECDFQCPAFDPAEPSKPYPKGNAIRTRKITQWDAWGGRQCPTLSDSRLCTQPMELFATFGGHEYLFSSALLPNRTDLNGTFDTSKAVAAMQSAWARAAASNDDYTPTPAPADLIYSDAISPYFPCMRVVSVKLVTIDLSANFSELETLKAEHETSLLLNASNTSFYLNASSSSDTADDANVTAAPTSTPTSAPTPPPTPMPLLTIEVQFEGMLLTSGAFLDPPTRYSKSAFDYLDTSLKALMLDVDRAAVAMTTTDTRVMVPVNISEPEGELVTAGNTSVRACCFQWVGGGVCPPPHQGLMGFLADSVATRWGPYQIQAFEIVTSMLQMAQAELLLPGSVRAREREMAWKRKAKGEKELAPLVMYYTLDGSTPNAKAGRRVTQGVLEQDGGVGLYMENLIFSHIDYGGQPLLAPVEITINAISSRTPPLDANASVAIAAPTAAPTTSGSEMEGWRDEGAVTNSTKEPEQNWVDSDMTSFTFTLAPPPKPTFSAEAISALTVSFSVMVSTAVAASIGASVGSSVAGSSAGSGGGGNPLDLIEQVQFMAVTGSMSVPLPEEYRAFASGFSWMNLQVRPPGGRIGEPPASEMEELEAEERTEGGGDGGGLDSPSTLGKNVGGARSRRIRRLQEIRRLRVLIEDDGTLTNSTEERMSFSKRESSSDGLQLMLLELGFSAEELFLGNLLAIVAGSVCVCILHILFNRKLVRRTNAKRHKEYRKALVEGKKVKKPEPYHVPKVLEFPRAELGFATVAALGFFQSSLCVLVDGNALGWVRTVAAISLLLIILPCIYALYMLCYIRSQIKFITYGSGHIQMPFVARLIPKVKRALAACRQRCCGPCRKHCKSRASPASARIYPGNDNHDNLKEHHGAAVSIQRMFRGALARKERTDPFAQQRKEQKEAATRIQSIYRRHQVNRKGAENKGVQGIIERRKEEAANLKKAAQYVGRWVPPEVEAEGLQLNEKERKELMKRQKLYERWKFLFDKFSPRGLLYVPMQLFFKVVVCLILVHVKGQQQAWALCACYGIWVWFILRYQPHITHRKSFKEIFSQNAKFLVLLIPLLALNGIIDTSAIAGWMMTANLGSIGGQAFGELTTAIQTIWNTVSFVFATFGITFGCNIGPFGISCGVSEEKLERVRAIADKLGSAIGLVTKIMLKPMAALTSGYTLGYTQAAQEWVVGMEEMEEEEEAEAEEGLEEDAINILESGYEEAFASAPGGGEGAEGEAEDGEAGEGDDGEEYKSGIAPPYADFHLAGLATATESLRALVMSEAMPLADELGEEDVGDGGAGDGGAGDDTLSGTDAADGAGSSATGEGQPVEAANEEPTGVKAAEKEEEAEEDSEEEDSEEEEEEEEEEEVRAGGLSVQRHGAMAFKGAIVATMLSDDHQKDSLGSVHRQKTHLAEADMESAKDKKQSGFLHRHLSTKRVTHAGQGEAHGATSSASSSGVILEEGYEQTKSAPGNIRIRKSSIEKIAMYKSTKQQAAAAVDENEDSEVDADDGDDDDENVAAVAEMTALMVAPHASKSMLPLGMKMVDSEFLGLSRIPIVKKQLHEFIKLAVDGAIILIAMGGLGKVRKAMTKAATKLQVWMRLRKAKRKNGDGETEEIELVVDTKTDDVRRQSRLEGVNGGIRRLSRKPKPVVPVDPRERRREQTKAAVKTFIAGGWKTLTAMALDFEKLDQKRKQGPYIIHLSFHFPFSALTLRSLPPSVRVFTEDKWMTDHNHKWELREALDTIEPLQLQESLEPTETVEPLKLQEPLVLAPGPLEAALVKQFKALPLPRPRLPPLMAPKTGTLMAE